jgi:hypothetical protein
MSIRLYQMENLLMATVSEQIQQIYIGLLGRAADKTGLDYWTNEIETNVLTLEQLRANIVNEQPEYAAGLGTQTRAQVVASLYENLFNRAPEAEGLEYWVNGGGSTVNIDQLVLALIDGAAAADTLVLDNKTDAAEYYTTTAGADYTKDAATAAVDDVDSTQASVDASKTATDSGSQSSGQTFTLTTGIDTLNGTSGNDTFVASFDGAATSTSNLGDSIDGGTGTDTVKVYSNAAATVVPNLTNVENLWINDTVHESRNVSTIAGLTSLELDSGTATAATAADTVITLGAGQSLTLDSVTDASGATADVANQEGIDIASAAGVTSLNLTVDGVGAQTAADTNNDLDLNIIGTGVATANVTATGTNNISLANAGGALTTLNIDGAGSLAVWGTTATTLTTVNAASNTGGVTLDLSASAGANQTITGGSGNDTLTVDLAQNITLDAGAGDDVVTLANPTAGNLSSATGAADSIKGGEGTDTLSLTAAGFVALAGDTAADRAVITGFEQVRVGAIDADTDAGAGFSADISAFGVNYLQVNGDITDSGAATAQTATVNGFTSGATVEFRDAAVAATQVALNIGMTGATGAGTTDDTLNLKLNDNLVNQPTAGAAAAESISIEVGVDGINKLNVTTADRDNTDGATGRDDGYTLTLTNAANVDTITVDGDRELSFTSGTATDALATFNAADLTGDLIVDLSGFTGTQGVTVTGGAGTNTLTGTGLADILKGGDRADTITGGAGADSLTGGAGADTFVFAAANFTAASSAALVAAADKITDFATSSDIINWDANLSVVQNGAAIGGNAAINAEGVASFAATDDTLAEQVTAVEAAIAATGNADGATAFWENGGNTYVFISEGTNGVGAGDALIELTGVTGLSDSTIATANLTLA